MPAATADERDQRAAIRFDTAMPVRIEGCEGETQNISAQGVYFETDVQQPIGSLVNFTVEYTLYGRRHTLLCEAKVVRVDRHGDRIGIAARLLAPFFAEEEALEG
ncbi:PilZ domain-containing protein [Ramlibacter pallidus]|uniref:PilZ domain-containing protein n=1 Tax=Ramlibacter pallidus TaxID=2780087 RepID=A0ABR9S3H7_9BURK|nr:PilZ domain-containing protein [Ramlibacter pallidus]MBE7368060.1 PilZ domain-containing protein [Ramlibacter pallidus]